MDNRGSVGRWVVGRRGTIVTGVGSLGHAPLATVGAVGVGVGDEFGSSDVFGGSGGDSRLGRGARGECYSPSATVRRRCWSTELDND